MKRYHASSLCRGKIGRRMMFRAAIPMLLLTTGWSMSANASLVVNSDVAFVENSLTGAPILSSPYGTLSATSVSPCSGTACQNNSVNPSTTSSSSLSSASGIGSAQSSADLTTGVLRAYAQEDGISGASAAAGAGFWDTLTFSGVTGVNPTATLQFNVSGSFADVGFGGACEGYRIGLNTGSTCGSGSGADPFGSGATILGSGDPSEVLSLLIPLANNTPTEIAVALGAAANGSLNIATADLYDPPTVSLIDLPPGVTYTSASGVFLTSPVPLPPALWLFGSGMIGLLAIARRCGPGSGEARTARG